MAQLTIPPRLAEAFFDAVRAYVRWPFAAPEPTIIVDQDDPVPINRVCRRVEMFTDPLPDEVFEALQFLATDETQRHLREKLGADRTYSTAGQCLLKLIEDGRARFATNTARPSLKPRGDIC
jgi:hypothetical protein